MKKAQRISMNAIVIAALALLVLVIIALVTTGRLGTFSAQTVKCTNHGGSCKIGACATNEIPYGGASCTGDEICCMPIKTAP